MYSRWQASWRSAWVVGAFFFAYALVQSWPGLSEAPTRERSIIFAMALGVGLLTLAVAASFQYGFRLSGIRAVGLPVMAATPSIYLVVVALLAAGPFKAPVSLLEAAASLEKEGTSVLMQSLLSSGSVVAALIVIAIAVSYSVARTLRGSTGVA